MRPTLFRFKFGQIVSVGRNKMLLMFFYFCRLRAQRAPSQSIVVHAVHTVLSYLIRFFIYLLDSWLLIFYCPPNFAPTPTLGPTSFPLIALRSSLAFLSLLRSSVCVEERERK